MYPLPPPSYFQQLNNYLLGQSRKLQELETKIGQLQQEIETLKKQRAMTVERIEYKFDQLKIERLDGTLHIGVSPDTGKSIEDFSINGDAMQMTEMQDTRLRSAVRGELDRFLDEEGPRLIAEKENDYRIVLGKQYVDFMIHDMKNQLDDRIAHYARTLTGQGEDVDGTPLHSAIVDKIKSDIRTAIDAHLRQKSSEGGRDA
ncbi:spore germination protein GerPC [Paenibacillus sp. GYB003]|uniref:spore germination protein GerPC n=1 Tax=Paenibacillus sp. GYB003 TaxID=2994392 RepID=UPI002F9627FA